jgi:hypothetical protein
MGEAVFEAFHRAVIDAHDGKRDKCQPVSADEPPLGRPKQVTDENREQLKQLKAQQRQDYLQRIPIEGKFG